MVIGMGRTKGKLPTGTEDEVRELLDLEAALQRDQLHYENRLIAVAEGNNVNALARELGISPFVLHKRVARIRRDRASVQQPNAA